MFVGKVVFEIGRDYPDVVFYTGINKHIDLNLSFIAEKTILCLGYDRSYFPCDNQVKQSTHAFTLIYPLCSTHAFIFINEYDFIGAPAKRCYVARKVNLLHVC